MGSTSIEWTRGDDGAAGRVWNCLRGCSRTSPGCGGGTPGPLKGGCYAEAIAERFSGPGQPFEGFAERGKGWTRKVALIPDKLCEPLSWRKPCRVFVNSMSDLFHEELKNEEIAAVFGVMAAAPRLTFQVLTKRAERMRDWFTWLTCEAKRLDQSNDFIVQQFAWRILGDRFPLHHIKGTILARPWPLPWVWLGVSVEDQRRADERIPALLQTPAAVRWLSCEPLLGPVDLNSACWGEGAERPSLEVQARQVTRVGGRGWDAGFTPAQALDWVVVGSESGRGARTMATDWARKIVDDCLGAAVAVFTKQIATPTGRLMRDPKGGDPKHWPPGNWPRQFPKVRA